jgi:hypothetical protein
MPGINIELVDSDPEKTQEAIKGIAELYMKVLKSSPDYVYLVQTNKIMTAYNQAIKLCFECRQLQVAAFKACDEDNGPAFIENYNNSRTKFKEVQSHIKSLTVSGFDKIPPLTEEAKVKFGAQAQAMENGHNALLEVKKFAGKLYKTTEAANKDVIKLEASLRQIGEEHKAGTLSADNYRPGKSAEVHPAGEAKAQKLPSLHEAKKEASQAQAKAAEIKPADLSRLSGGAISKAPNQKKS